MSPDVPLRAWCFTVFNPTPEVEEKVVALQFLSERLVVGREKCPETGTLHLQGYIRTEKSHRFTGIKKLLPDGAHVEPRKGRESQATAYCKKDGQVLVDKGIDVDRGKDDSKKRTRDEELDEILEEIEKGEKYGAIRNRHKKFFFWHRRNVVDFLYDQRRLVDNPDYTPSSLDEPRPWRV